MPVEDPGRPNPPGHFDSRKVRWEQTVPADWWRNNQKALRLPLAFTKANGRFSGPALPYGVLYLGASPAACFWESGLGRDLNSRMPEDMAFSESDLKSRWEYHLRIKPRGLRIFNAGDAVARRSIGAKTAACFSADHAVSRLWAEALMNAGADGILYESTRHSPGLCLALFQTKASMASLSAARRIGSSYDNSSLLAELFTEGVSIMAGNFPITPQKIHDS
ncbi:MAG: RES family NAD+ phosphorylase [Verrucomicrobiota bacterium]